MTRKELEELQKICNEASPGPWEASGNYPFYIDMQKPARSLSKHDLERPTYWSYQDGKYVLAARDAMPKLLDMLNRVINNLKKEIERDYPKLNIEQKFALLDSRFSVLTSSDSPELVKADLGVRDE